MTGHRLTALAAVVKVGPVLVPVLLVAAWLAGRWLQHDTEKGWHRDVRM